MADKTKKKEPKLVLEREYIVPLRREWLKVGMHKRANRAIKELKIFMARHMKVYDRDLRKIKIDQVLNNEIRFRGMRKPPAKIRVKAKKFDDETVRVELIDIPNHVKFARLREEKIQKEVEKKVEAREKIEEKKSEEVKQQEKASSASKETEDSKIAEEAKEKEETSRDETLKLAKEQAREQKHTSKPQGSVEKSFMTKKSQKGR